ncbi:plastocyanin/azurin family copper-binding protein [Rubellicoccus peritrichatus]|uniref:Blue (type 1) copper domain-containing protein n=1 Tax=Rubellicoccus peritrichatus TaxID=3080537 RepID=A0AAQ3QYD5_9BACT|nr:plastocyanin/azurin family copper-binding protein [Puniceicoccus sp. CR14]WOO43680.1 hypothetical protein RZN69_11320 [Puniceicoccus sp. CR14]
MIDSSKLPKPARLNPRYLDGATERPGMAPQARAVIYAERISDKADAKTSNETKELAQQHLQFEKSVLPVQVGTTVHFPNRDEVFHNVFSYSAPKSFDLGRYRAGEEPGEVVFDQPGEVQVFCEIHRHMRTTVLVLDTPYFTVSNDSNTYDLKDLPAGDYRVSIWYGPGKTLSKEVTLTDEENLKIDWSEE